MSPSQLKMAVITASLNFATIDAKNAKRQLCGQYLFEKRSAGVQEKCQFLCGKHRAVLHNQDFQNMLTIS